jgi:SAM-dependent methyltransferase
VYAANFSPEDLNAEVFSARRLPDRIHFRMVRCRSCGLIRSDPTIDRDLLDDLYGKSRQTYDAEVPNLQRTYSRYLDYAVRRLDSADSAHSHKRHLLEIGCGNGFFLEKALGYGFQEVTGIEPSRQAVEKSPARVRDRIIHGMLLPGLLPQEQFDVICMFQVFDHLAAPGAALDECRRSLVAGGGVLCLNHDVAAPSARLLGERSPIIDIEHTYLYSRATICRIFADHGFRLLDVGTAWNLVSLNSLCRLFPLPGSLKRGLLSLLAHAPEISRIGGPLPIGNLYLIAQKA